MTIAEELRAEGRMEGEIKGLTRGRAEGRVEGALIGQVQALERVLGMSETPASVLAERSPVELRERIETLNREIHQRLSQ